MNALVLDEPLSAEVRAWLAAGDSPEPTHLAYAEPPQEKDGPGTYFALFLAGVMLMWAVAAFAFYLAAPPLFGALGRIWYGAVWPAWPISAYLHRLAIPVPVWALAH